MVGDDPLLPYFSLSQTLLESHTVDDRSLPFVVYALVERLGRMDVGANWKRRWRSFVFERQEHDLILFFPDFGISKSPFYI